MVHVFEGDTCTAYPMGDEWGGVSGLRRRRRRRSWFFTMGMLPAPLHRPCVFLFFCVVRWNVSTELCCCTAATFVQHGKSKNGREVTHFEVRRGSDEHDSVPFFYTERILHLNFATVNCKSWVMFSFVQSTIKSFVGMR